MTKEEYKDGMAVIAKGRKAFANGLELCGDGKYVIHVAFIGKEAQWRVPIEQVEVQK